MIPYARQCISEEDIDAVINVLRSDFITQGPAVPRFEQNVAQYCKAKYAVAVNSATSALHIACIALNIGPGDCVWTSPNSFVASANCARYCGADIDFVDIDSNTFNMCPKKLAEKLEYHEKNGLMLPKLVVVVHFGGAPCEMNSIGRLANKYNFRIIEDASHAIGAIYNDNPIGNCKYSDITVFSFHPVKIITTGEGGMALTNDPVLARDLTLLRSHGITRDQNQMNKKADGPWYYEQVRLGFNYRISDIQAALGNSQLANLGQFIKNRNELAQNYDNVFKDIDNIKFQYIIPNCYSARHLYVIRIPNNIHKKVFINLRNENIGVNLHYIPIYLQPDFSEYKFSSGYCPEAENYYMEAISLPMYSHLTEQKQQAVIDSVIRNIT